jgi:hypothetical protein
MWVLVLYEGESYKSCSKTTFKGSFSIMRLTVSIMVMLCLNKISFGMSWVLKSYSHFHIKYPLLAMQWKWGVGWGLSTAFQLSPVLDSTYI